MANLPPPDDLLVLDRARRLVKAMYRTFHEDARMARDYNLCAALQKPALSLVSTLANAAASGQIGYYERGVRFARSYCAEIRALLDVAQDVEAIEDGHHRDLQARVVEIQTLLASLSSALERRVTGI